MSRGVQYTTDEIITALEKAHGGVYLAAEALGCSHKTIERRAKDVQAVQDVIDKYQGRRTDIAELGLDVALANGEAWAIQFQLTKSKDGKKRGYGERTEHTGEGGGAIKQETRNVVEIVAVDYRTVAAKIAPGSVPDSDAPGESQSAFDGSAVG